ncbi:hypothetical protein QBC35DRAFT_48153 [Podospora australis]|uniref:F-box domain-containing protein n=1 Tax=Podospora australis TaxID=1536484 RepID=A0AAN6WQK1_9PEZI|nr:hypothetical protein QBC35DRAFT_48153 [Podospora australis]
MTTIPLHRIPLDNTRHTWPPSIPLADLGTLSIFPTEILTDILQHLDLPTLTSFRTINRRFMTLIDIIPSYNYIFHTFPAVLRAVIVSQASSPPYFTSCLALSSRLRLCRQKLSSGKPILCEFFNDAGKPAQRGGITCDHPAGFLSLQTGAFLCKCCYISEFEVTTPLLIEQHLSRRNLTPQQTQDVLASLPQSLSLPKDWFRPSSPMGQEQHPHHRTDAEGHSLPLVGGYWQPSTRQVIYPVSAVHGRWQTDNCRCIDKSVLAGIRGAEMAIIGLGPDGGLPEGIDDESCR